MRQCKSDSFPDKDDNLVCKYCGARWWCKAEVPDCAILNNKYVKELEEKLETEKLYNGLKQ